MRRIAAPMVGGVVSATLVTLIVMPVFFVLIHGRGLPRAAVDDDEKRAFELRSGSTPR
jgi:Cu(I)/Ag(I) efflux system membrane protein CusA/SilA